MTGQRRKTARGLLTLSISSGIFATTLVSSVTAHATTLPVTTNHRQGPLFVNQHLWRDVPYFTANHTTFFGIWYLQQLFKSYGYATKWDGHSLLLPEIPVVSLNATTRLNGKNISSTSGTLTFQGTTYVDAKQVVQALGGTATFDSSKATLILKLPVQPSSSSTNNLTVASSDSPTVTGGGIASSSSTAVNIEERSLKVGSSAVWEGKQLWRTAPTVVYRQSTYFGVWYLQQLFHDHGIESTWNGTKLSIPDIPKEFAQAKLAIASAGSTSSTTTTTPLFQWQGDTYLPVSALQSLGVQSTVNPSTHDVSLTTASTGLKVTGIMDDHSGNPIGGTVAVEDANGSVHVFSAAADGSFSGTVSTDAATVIGVRTTEDGWVGEDVPVTTSNSAPVSVTAWQTMTTVQGHVGFASSTTYPVVQVALRNVITHAHYYATVHSDGSFTATVPVGSYEVFDVTTDKDAIFLLQHFIAGGPKAQVKVTLPALPSGSTVQTQHAKIHAADSNVTPEEMLSVANIFEYVDPSTSNEVGIQMPSSVQINLFGSAKTYQQHYVSEGYSKTEAQQIAELSVASEEGKNTINVLMPNFNTVDGLNILAHEFTHALIAQESTAIPSWANEGAAWTDGVNVQTDQSPSQMLKLGIQWDGWVDIVAHQKAGNLIALGQTSSLNTTYNVEAQDYYAVQQLIAQFGWNKFMKYVGVIDKDSHAFQDTFGESFASFSNSVTTALKKDAANADSVMHVRVRTLPNGPKQVYFIDPDGQRFLVSGLEPNQTYDFVCNTSGTVTAPTGLTVTSVSSISVAISGDWYLGSGGDGGQNRQEFDLVNQFGIPFVDQIFLYDAQGNIQHVYPATAIPNGLELVQLSN